MWGPGVQPLSPSEKREPEALLGVAASGPLWGLGTVRGGSGGGPRRDGHVKMAVLVGYPSRLPAFPAGLGWGAALPGLDRPLFLISREWLFGRDERGQGLWCWPSGSIYNVRDVPTPRGPRGSPSMDLTEGNRPVCVQKCHLGEVPINENTGIMWCATMGLFERGTGRVYRGLPCLPEKR